MRIAPAPGVKVRDPITKRYLPAEGAEVPESAYWMRRLRAAEVVLQVPAPEAPEEVQ